MKENRESKMPVERVTDAEIASAIRYLDPAPEWAKHLRPYVKRRLWKKVRRIGKLALSVARWDKLRK